MPKEQAVTPPPETPAKTPDEIRRSLRFSRGLRWTFLICLFGPVVFTVIAVFLNKTGLYPMHFLVSGEPWTHTFWNWMFNVFALGGALALLNRARKCPRCGRGFNVRHGWHPRKNAEKGGFARFNVNAFGRKCLNCGLKLDGSNADEPL